MAGKAKRETAQEQSERFIKAAQDMIDADELSPTADAVERVMSVVVRLRRDWFEGSDQECPPSELGPQGD